MNPKRPLLLLLTPGFPASADDSACLPMHALFVRTLAAHYPSVDILVVAFQYPYRKEDYRLHGAAVLPMNGRNGRGLFAWKLRRKVLRTLLRLASQQPVVGVLSFWYADCAAVGERFAQRTGLPHYCWILGQDARAANRWPARLAIPPERLLALSPFLKSEFMRNHHRVPAHLLLPGIDPALFAAPAPPRDIHLMAAGSLIPLKRFERFVQLVARARQQLPELRAVLAGAGPEETRLKALALQLGVDRHICFTGVLPQPDVLTLMQRTRVFVHPSSYEGFSGVCMEALAAGAHVVSHFGAMETEVPQWHIVPENDRLLGEVLRLLKAPPPRAPVQPFLMTDTVRTIASFFPGLAAAEEVVDLPGNGPERELPLKFPDEPRA
ncbi:MAG: glycosyltransferase [Chitinophagaceae bacterium]|nr:MAG: glycosyltransferase [Chitinophagaceae bacterium]